MDKIFFFIKQNFLVILGAALLTLLLLSPSVILQTCPKGLTYDTFPGQCPLFVDQNQDSACDLVQGITTKPSSQFNSSHALEFSVFLILFIIAAALLFVKHDSRVRYAFLLFSFLLFLFYFKSVCPLAILQLLFLQKDRIVLNIFPFLIFLLPILVAIILGRIFCGWLCPIGAFQELLFRIPRWLRLKIPNFSEKIPKIFNILKYLVLIFVAAGVLIFKKSIFCKAGPFGILFGCNRGLIYFLLFLVICLLSLVSFRFFCRFLCPYGALLALFSKLTIFKVKIDPKKCTNCELCQEKCLIGAIDKNQKVNESECIRCQECLKSCPKEAIFTSW